MDNQNVKKSEKIFGIIKYICGVIGFFAIVAAILTVSGLVDDIIIKTGYLGGFSQKTKLIVSLSTSIGGIFFLFIAFSRQLDKFFGFLETHTVTKSDETIEKKGITIESIFFLFIAVILIFLTILLSINALVLKTNLPILGKSTRGVLIGALIVLSILAIITAFNRTIADALREMKKVHWPTGKEMSDYSKRVFTFIVFFSLFFFAWDVILDNVPGAIAKLLHLK